MAWRERVPYSAAVREASIEVAVSAAEAWTLLTDVERIPAWVPGVAEAAVLERAERPTLVQFVTMPATGSLVYRVRYEHDEAERTVRWSSVDGDDRGLAGGAHVIDLGGGRARLHYRLQGWAGRAVPRWAQAALADDTAQRTVEAFRRWAEGQPPAPAGPARAPTPR